MKQYWMCLKKKDRTQQTKKPTSNNTGAHMSITTAFRDFMNKIPTPESAA